MNTKLFQNDSITANSLIGFEIKGNFKDNEDVLIEKMKELLNRNVTFTNLNYKLLEPTDTSASISKKSESVYLIKTPLYSYFEALYLMPKILEYLKTLKTYKGSYFYIKIGFNEDTVNLHQLNILKFIFEYNEDFILKSLSDITKKTIIDKITVIKPSSLENCGESIRKQVEGYKFLGEEDDNFGISFTSLKSGYVTFKYAQGINYREKWEDILKCMNHTIITLYNTSKNFEFDESEIAKIEKLQASFQDYATAFGCYEMFDAKYKSLKLTVDLNNDKSVINMLFPSIKEQLFTIVVYNELKDVTVNYDSDVSKLQIKDADIKNCYNLHHIDIVNCDITESCIKDCDLYDSNIKDSSIYRCNLFGYADCEDVYFDDCFVSRNIKLKNCDVHGQLGKMAGTMIGGTLKDTTVIISLADIHDNVEKDNINEIE